MSFVFKGLQTLKVKETDRIIALQNECKKLGIELSVTNNSIEWNGEESINKEISDSIVTYNDHRMAMSFAPLCLLVQNITIENAEVVSKSYPEFWQHLKFIGINYTQIL
jgi:3-phosphoshikimate 1-carboxyvinyltransferase